jgi:hypothetical protein
MMADALITQPVGLTGCAWNVGIRESERFIGNLLKKEEEREMEMGWQMGFEPTTA